MTRSVLDRYALSAVKTYKGKLTPVKVCHPTQVIGLELEIENLINGGTWYESLSGPFWCVVEDGSLRPRGASWEFVSRPAQAGVALAETARLFETIKVNESNYTDRCSVHVHANVQHWTNEQLLNLALVYPVFEQVLFQFVNHHDAPSEQGYCRDTNLYCIPWNHCRLNRRISERFVNENRQTLRGWEKYTALNLLPIGEHGTVEWRHMHGTCNMQKLTTWVDIICAIMKFCEENTLEDISRTIKILNDVSTYQQFFTAVLQNTLPYVDEYRGKMSEGVLDAKFSLIVGNESSKSNIVFDDDIAQGLNIVYPMRAVVPRHPGAVLDDMMADFQQQAIPGGFAPDGAVVRPNVIARGRVNR